MSAPSKVNLSFPGCDEFCPTCVYHTGDKSPRDKPIDATYVITYDWLRRSR